MKEYLNLLTAIKDRGTKKPAAREGMPGTTSLFGYQFRHNLAEGFPLITTKEVKFKHIVIELLWFLRGDTNISYLVKNGVNIWNEDAYKFYINHCDALDLEGRFTFEDFVDAVKHNAGGLRLTPLPANYRMGDCGNQYGKVWRDYQGKTDQIRSVLQSLLYNPESRRHIVSAIDPVNDGATDLALYWCHSMFQFNCRPLSVEERLELASVEQVRETADQNASIHKILDGFKIPKYYLDCQMYQRSADVILGVPYNIASYALLTHLFAEVLNMIPGEYIHTFGDVHIYDNHVEAVDLQLTREPKALPSLKIDISQTIKESVMYTTDFSGLRVENFVLENYNPHPKIKAKLSTGLK